MMEDIVGDYKDKTVTLEDFPYFSNNVKMATVHPCRHASVMKTLLDRADGALKIRREKQRKGLLVAGKESGMEGLVDDMARTSIGDNKGGFAEGAKYGGNGNDEWEVLPNEASEMGEEEVAIRVDQYLVVFLKVCLFDNSLSIALHLKLTHSSQFIASVTPGIEHDFTMGV